MNITIIITCIALGSGIFIGCEDMNKEFESINSNVNVVEKKTINEVMNEYADSSVSISKTLFDLFQKIFNGNIMETKSTLDNLMANIDNSLENIKEYSYFKGKEKKFIKEAVKSLEATKSYATMLTDMITGTLSIESFKEIGEMLENFMKAQEDCMDIMEELGFEYKYNSNSLLFE